MMKSELVGNGSIDFACLLDEFLDNGIDVALFKVGHVDALLHTVVVASHHRRLSIEALTHDEREVRVLLLNVNIVVLNEGSI